MHRRGGGSGSGADTPQGVEDLARSAPTREMSADGTPFQALVVVEFFKATPHEAVEWLQRRVAAPRIQGGGELLAHVVKDNNGGRTMLFVSGRTERLLLAAELMEIKKPYKDGSLREISMADIEFFQGSDDLDSFLQTSEKQRIIVHELESIRALEGEASITGLPALKLYQGQALIPALQHDDVIKQVFPLHEKEKLKALGRDWYQKLMGVQPLERIHEYFGETVAMYFAFLGFYTMSLIPPAIIGILSAFSVSGPPALQLDLVVFFSVFNLVWASLFLESWKRSCASQAYKWGTIHSEPFEEARAAYHGSLGVNAVTGRLEPKYPKWKRAAKFYCVSLPVVLACLAGAFFVMLGYFWLEHVALEYDEYYGNALTYLLRFMPTVAYAVVISGMNAVYRRLATALNDWENHRLQSAYENHLITKLVLFDFVNCFMSLFYVAFYMQDIQLLRRHLAALLITQQILGQIMETVVPYLLYKRRKISIKNRHQNSTEEDEQTAVDDDSRLAAEIEGSKDNYLSTLDDYLELYLQFGYVSLFSAVFPSAAFWALLNNVTEIRMDAFKMVHVFQRPVARPTAGIGAWQVAFEMMGVMAVMTNCALIGLSPWVKDYAPSDYGDTHILFLFVVAEHVILFVKVLIAYLIPDEPDWVQKAIGRVEYQSKQAWRKQRLMEARHNRAKRQRHAADDHPTVTPNDADDVTSNEQTT